MNKIMLNFTLCRMVLFERSPSANVKSATNVICQNISNGGSILQCLLKFKSKSNIKYRAGKGQKVCLNLSPIQAPFCRWTKRGAALWQDSGRICFGEGGCNGGNDEARSKFAQIYTKIKWIEKTFRSALVALVESEIVEYSTLVKVDFEGRLGLGWVENIEIRHFLTVEISNQ